MTNSCTNSPRMRVHLHWIFRKISTSLFNLTSMVWTPFSSIVIIDRNFLSHLQPSVFIDFYIFMKILVKFKQKSSLKVDNPSEKLLIFISLTAFPKNSFLHIKNSLKQQESTGIINSTKKSTAFQNSLWFIMLFNFYVADKI